MSYGMLPRFLLPAIIVCSVGCGGGGGGGGGSGIAKDGVQRWLATAGIASDTCGERIADVTQKFDIDFSAKTIDTGAATVPIADVDGAKSFGFSEVNGDCKRTYQGSFSNISGATANVAFSSLTSCPTGACESTWIGTAAKIN